MRKSQQQKHKTSGLIRATVKSRHVLTAHLYPHTVQGPAREMLLPFILGLLTLLDPVKQPSEDACRTGQPDLGRALRSS